MNGLFGTGPVMISVSHWGLFNLEPRILIVSKEMGEALEKHRTEWLRPDGFIELRRA